MKRRSRRAHTIGSSETLKSDSSTFSFDENFVLVLTEAPRLQVQVLDETQQKQRKYVTIKKLVLTLAVLYKGLLLLLNTKTWT